MEKKQWKDVLHIVHGKNQKDVVDPAGKYPVYGSGGIIGYANDYLCEAGTTIVGRKGTINRPLFVDEKFWNVDTAFGITPSKKLVPMYLFYFCQSFNFTSLDKSTTIPSLSKSVLLNIEMPVPPLAEQERIVSRIEELFSQLDAGIDTLKKTKAQLGVYRQAVLKEAFDSAVAKTVELNEIVVDIRIGPFGTSLHKEDYIEGGIPVINPQHIKNNAIVASHKITISTDKAKELESYRLQQNDIIMGRRGEMGRCAPISDLEDGWICGTGSIRLRMKPEFDATFYSQILSSPNVVRYLEENATGTTMKNLNEDIVKHMPVPYLTSDIQKKVKRMIDSKSSVCDSIEQTVDSSLQQSESLRQSILKEAFEGRL